MYRVEDKYYPPPQKLFVLERLLSSALRCDENGENGAYTISSLYFDDLDDSMYRDTENGVPHREKYRIRIYNNSFDTIKLEVKRKDYNRIWKDSCGITKEEMQALCNGEQIECNSGLSDPRTMFNLKIMQKGLRPKVIVTYERRAYLFDTGEVRITFDRNIRGSNMVDRFGDPVLTYDIPNEGESVLEVKYDELLPDFIAQLLECGDMWQTANSKYKLCRDIYR